MTMLAAPIAAMLAIVALVGLASERDLAVAPIRAWVRSAVLAATALFLGLAIRGPVPSPAVDGALGLAPVWHVLLVSSAIVLALVAGHRSSDVRTLGTGLAMAVLTLAAALVQQQPLAVALLAGGVGLLGIPALVESQPTAQQVRTAVRFFVFFAFAALALVAATALADVSLQSGNVSILGPAVGLLAVAALTIAGAFPFHVWLPPLVDSGSRYGAVMVVGLAQVAGLGAVITTVITLPWLLADSWQPTWIVLAAMSGLISAALALGESHPQRAVAHLLGLQGAMVVVGLASRTQVGMVGALIILLALGPTLVLVLAESSPTTTSNDSTWRTAGSSIGRASWLIRGIGWLSLLGLPPALTFWGRSLVVAAILAMPSADLTSADADVGVPSGPMAAAMLVVAQVVAILAAVRHASVVLRGNDAAVAIEGHSLSETSSTPVSPLVRVAIATAVVGCGLFPGPIVGAIERALRGLPLG